ncbi:MAG: ABC transporter substrate-binding protein [Alphaproteobacteria bacterium]|nr:ABC transporter substrate-binding protein [Alphaproteobacteria bacterium]
MKTLYIRLAGGPMKIITVSSFIGVVLSLWLTAAEAKISNRIALYGQSKYADNFKAFDYVNPHAPQGGKIVLPAYGTFDNFNPYIFKGVAASFVPALTMETLGFSPVDDPFTVYPLLAEKFDLPADKSYVGFILNPKARFANGLPVTADDVVFSFNSIMEKGSPIYKMYYADVDRVEKINEREVRFYFKEGTDNKELPMILAQFHIFSAQDWQGREFDKPTLQVPLGSGPYVVDDFQVNKYISFKKNPNYWGNNLPTRRGFYNFEQIRYDYYQDTTVTLQALFAGNIDAREEYIAKIWMTGYDNELIKSGKIKKEVVEHNNPAILQNFAYNIRRNKLKDRRVRKALDLAFNYEWANEKLFYGQYKRLYSYFTNTGMEATGLPQGRELKILEQYKDQLPPEVFTEPYQPTYNPEINNPRENLKKAVKLLQEAGYDFVDGKMTNLATGEPLEVEILSNSANGATFTKVMLPYIENLRKIGIKAVFRNLEVNIFKNRLDNFDFDMAIVSYRVSQLPGNEQREYWGSEAADMQGSNNVIGIKNPVVDALIKGLISAQQKEDYVAYVKALDRVLLHENYLIFQWYSPVERVAYWDKFGQPQTDIKTGFEPFTWWAKEQ